MDKPVSIIVPVYNEEKILQNNIKSFEELSQYAELIFVDGGSVDRSVDCIKTFAKVLHSGKGRAKQMNLGAKHASSNILFFMHADNMVSIDTLESIQKHIVSGLVGGCLSQHLDHRGLIYRLVEAEGNCRAWLTKVFYGDQGIFVRKKIFFDLGGFADVPIMEDAIFSKQMTKVGKTKILKNKINVSARRWEQRGVINTIVLYSLLNVLYLLKVPLYTIKQYYDDVR